MALVNDKKWGRTNGALAAIVLAAVAFYVLNLLSPEFHDDFVYKFMLVNGSVDYSRPVNSLADVFRSQWEHYFVANGRSVVHVLVQVFTGLLGKQIFNVLSAIVFAIFVYLLQYNVTRHLRGKGFFAVTFTLFLVLLLPLFKDTFLWMTGSVNYLWSGTAVLLFLSIYESRGHLLIKDSRVVVWMLPLALFMGWTHEGLSLPLAVSLLVLNLLDFKRSRHTWGFWLTVAFLVGACITAFAPGNLVRSSAAGGFALSTLGLKVLNGITVFGHLRIVYLAILLTAVLWLVNRPLAHDVLRQNRHLLLAMLLSVGIVLVAGLTSQRTAFGLELFSMVFVLRLVGQWSACLKGKTLNWCAVALSVLLIGFYALLLSHTIPTWQETQRLIAQIERNEDGIIGTREHDAGVFSGFVRTMISNDAARNAINYDSQGWPLSIAATYHRDSLVFLPQAFLDDLAAHAERYERLDFNTPFEFFIQRIDDPASVREVAFSLSPADFDSLPFFFRPIAQHMNKYTANVVVTDKWATVKLFGKNYLLIKKDHDLDSRLIDIKIR